MADLDRERVADGYARFAREQAAGKSASYERCAAGIAGADEVLDFLLTLPPEKRQPNLLFASLWFLGHPFECVDDIVRAIGAHEDDLRRCILSRWTQTNEPGRCAALLPFLARLPQPLHLIEVGTAGGLCLYPDRYAYVYDGQRIGSNDPDAPVLPCDVLGDRALDLGVPHVVGRVGIDRAPIDLGDETQVRWLQALVWPEQTDRAARLRQAIETVRRDPPRIVEGDLIDRLPEVVASAPRDATTVVFHTAVLCYLPPDQRAVFRELVDTLPVTWISNEDRSVFPDIEAPAPPRQPSFVVAVDGQAVATTDPHGGWLAYA